MYSVCIIFSSCFCTYVKAAKLMDTSAVPAAPAAPPPPVHLGCRLYCTHVQAADLAKTPAAPTAPSASESPVPRIVYTRNVVAILLCVIDLQIRRCLTYSSFEKQCSVCLAIMDVTCLSLEVASATTTPPTSDSVDPTKEVSYHPNGPDVAFDSVEAFKVRPFDLYMCYSIWDASSLRSVV